MILRRACELQLYALFLALPFEYYFRSRDETLFTTLKLQILLFGVSWMGMKSFDALSLGRARWRELKPPVPGRLLAAVASFVLAQALAAAVAPEFTANAIKAAVKTGLGGLLAVAAADLVAGSPSGKPGRSNTLRSSMIALSISGALTAVLGLGELAGMDFFGSVVRLFQSSKFFLGDRVRFISTMEHPNTAGTLLAAALCSSLALAVFPGAGRGRQKLWKVAWLGLAAVQGLALVLTFSRGAMASTILATLVASWVFRRKFDGTQKRMVIAACFVATLVGTSGLYLARRGAEREDTPSGRNQALWGMEAAQEVRCLLPGHTYQERIAVENTSPLPWRGGDCGVGFKWYSLSTDQTQPLVAGAAFTDAVAPDQRVRIPVSLTTPPDAGEYVLIWFVTCRGGEMKELKDSFSPGIICIIGPAGADSPRVISDRAHRYLAAIRDERRHLHRTVAPGRSELWCAALRMASQSPLLGTGPDSFRLLKSRYMDFPSWDETILANNLYLEMLSGSGILGLMAFLWLLWEFGRTLAARVALASSPADCSAAWFGVAYFTAFALHGLVDFFLKFTPTFLLFWLLLGMLGSGRGNRETHANRL